MLRAKELEVAAVRAAEGGNVGDALELLNLAATEAPEYASVYNNRAQVRCSLVRKLSSVPYSLRYFNIIIVKAT